MVTESRGEDTSEVMRDPCFRRLWFADGFRYSAAEVAAFALPITAVLLLEAGPMEIGLIAVCARIGYLAVGLPAGAWIDRWTKRTVMIIAEIVYALAFASVPVAYWLDWLTVPHLFVVAAATSVAGVFFDVSHISVLPLIITKRRVADGNARLQTSKSTIQAVAPSTAGVLTQVVAAPLLYAMASFFHLVSLLLVRSIRVDEDAGDRRHGRRRRLRQEIVEGLRIVVRQPLLRLLISQAALNNLGAGVILTVLPLFLLRDIGMEPWMYGLLSTMGAVAGITASLVAPGLRRRFGEIRMTMVFSALAPVAVVAAPMAGLIPAVAVPLVATAQMLIGFVVVGRAIAAAGLRVRVTSTLFMARVTAANGVVTQGTLPLGALIGGAMAAVWSTSTALWIGVVIMAIPVVLLVRSPLRKHRSLPPEWEKE